MQYYLILRDQKQNKKEWLDLLSRLKRVKREMLSVIAKEASAKVKINRGEIAEKREVDGNLIKVLAYTVNKVRRYGKSNKSIRLDMIYLSYSEEDRVPPDYSHYLCMNLLRRQIKAYMVINNSKTETARAEKKWANCNKPKVLNINFKQVRTGYKLDDKTLEEFGNILGAMNAVDKRMKICEQKQEAREKQLGVKYENYVEDTCSLCLYEGGLVSIKCQGNHAFHPHCITELFYDFVENWEEHRVVKCPLCRVNLN